MLKSVHRFSSFSESSLPEGGKLKMYPYRVKRALAIHFGLSWREATTVRTSASQHV